MKNVFVYIVITVSSIFFGLAVLFNGHLLQSVGVFDILALRFLLSAVVYLILILTGILKVHLRGKDIRLLLVAAIFEPIAFFIFEALGIRGTTAIMAGIIGALTPIFITITEGIILREKTTLLQKGCLLLGIAGAIYIILNTTEAGGKNGFFGILFMLLAVTVGALFVACSRKASRTFTATEITFMMVLEGAVVFNLINIVLHISKGTLAAYFQPLLRLDLLGGFLFLSVVHSILAFTMNNYALSKIQASSVAAFGGVSTIVTIAAGVLINHEGIHLYHIIGTLLILIGAVGVNYLQAKKKGL